MQADSYRNIFYSKSTVNRDIGVVIKISTINYSPVYFYFYLNFCVSMFIDSLLRNVLSYSCKLLVC